MFFVEYVVIYQTVNHLIVTGNQLTTDLIRSEEILLTMLQGKYLRIISFTLALWTLDLESFEIFLLTELEHIWCLEEHKGKVPIQLNAIEIQLLHSFNAVILWITFVLILTWFILLFVILIIIDFTFRWLVNIILTIFFYRFAIG